MTSSARIAAEPSSEMRVFRALTVLPSESGIHFLVYCSLVFLTLLFVVATPAIVLFFREHRPTMGIFFVTVNLIVFLASFALNLNRHLDVPRPGFRDSLMRQLIRALRRTPLATGVIRRMNMRLTPAWAPFPEASARSAFFRFYCECWNNTSELKSLPPKLYWSYQDRQATARAAGNSQDPVVAVSAGLVSLFPRQSEAVRVYLFHEFGHVLNRDLEVFGLMMAASRASSAVITTSSLLGAIYLLRFFNGDIWGALILLVSIMWFLAIGVLWLFLARYAGAVISLRELYADVRAVVWLEGLAAYESVLGQSPGSRLHRLWTSLRSLLSLRLIHLSPGERLAFLRRPRALLLPRHRYYLLAGILLVVLQSNPFGEGYENNWMRWPFLLAWALAGLAYLMNLGRAIDGLALVPNNQPVRALAGLSLGMAAVLLLPMFRIPGLYGDLILGVGKWESLWSGVDDSLKTIVAQWAHAEFLWVPVLALLWLGLSYWFAHDRIRGSRTENPGERVARSGWSFSVLAGVAVLAETAILAIRDYSNEHPTVIDAWQHALRFRPAPQILSLCVLLVGSRWVWRPLRESR